MIREKLREHTQELHQRLERRLDLLKIKDLNSYCHVIERFYGFVSPLESLLVGTIAELGLYQDERLSFAGRVKAQLLESDLAFLSKNIDMANGNPEMAGQEDLPSLRSAASVLGCLYVIEGSTLGGQFLTSHFEKALGLKPEQGLSYFAGYRSQTGRMWKSYLAFLEESIQDHPEWTDEVLASANETFKKMEQWLTQ